MINHRLEFKILINNIKEKYFSQKIFLFAFVFFTNIIIVYSISLL